MNKIIAVVGLCGSGKSVISHFFEQIGYTVIHFGNLTMEEVAKQKLPVNEANERLIRERLRSEHGMGAYAILSFPKIEQALKRGNNILIDGLYSFTEYKILKEKYQILVLAVFTPKNIRYDRLSKRKIRSLTPNQAEKRDFAEIKNLEKGGPIAMADYTIINDSSENHLKNELAQFVENIL